VYRVKESDGFAVIKLLVSGYRRSSLQVEAKAFVQTKFNLPAGDIHEVVVIIYGISVLQRTAKILRLAIIILTVLLMPMRLSLKFLSLMTMMKRKLNLLQSICLKIKG